MRLEPAAPDQTRIADHRLDLPDRVFNARLVASRTPFWDTLERDGDWFRAYFLSVTAVVIHALAVSGDCVRRAHIIKPPAGFASLVMVPTPC